MDEDFREIITAHEVPEIVVADHNSHVSFPEHWHLFAEIIYSTCDRSVYSVRGTEYTLEKGDILIIWPTELHAILNCPQQGSKLIQFNADFIRENSDIAMYYRSMQALHRIDSSMPELREKLEKYILKIVDLRISRPDFWGIRMKILLYEMVMELAADARDHAEELNRSLEHFSHQSETYLKIQAACKFIADNCEKDLMQAQVSNYIGFSPYYFSRIFKKYTDESYSEYLTRQRIRKAVEMLSSDNVPITEVGFYSGFQSVSNFNRAFKSIMNCSPTQFRKMHTGTPAESEGGE